MNSQYHQEINIYDNIMILTRNQFYDNIITIQQTHTRAMECVFYRTKKPIYIYKYLYAHTINPICVLPWFYRYDLILIKK